jgi:hypothetical protein
MEDDELASVLVNATIEYVKGEKTAIEIAREIMPKLQELNALEVVVAIAIDTSTTMIKLGQLVR